MTCNRVQRGIKHARFIDSDGKLTIAGLDFTLHDSDFVVRGDSDLLARLISEVEKLEADDSEIYYEFEAYTQATGPRISPWSINYPNAPNGNHVLFYWPEQQNHLTKRTPKVYVDFVEQATDTYIYDSESIIGASITFNTAPAAGSTVVIQAVESPEIPFDDTLVFQAEKTEWLRLRPDLDTRVDSDFVKSVVGYDYGDLINTPRILDSEDVLALDTRVDSDFVKSVQGIDYGHLINIPRILDSDDVIALDTTVDSDFVKSVVGYDYDDLINQPRILDSENVRSIAIAVDTTVDSDFVKSVEGIDYDHLANTPDLWDSEESKTVIEQQVFVQSNILHSGDHTYNLTAPYTGGNGINITPGQQIEADIASGSRLYINSGKLDVHDQVIPQDSDWILRQIYVDHDPADSDWILRQIPTNLTDSDYLNRTYVQIANEFDSDDARVATGVQNGNNYVAYGVVPTHEMVWLNYNSTNQGSTNIGSSNALSNTFIRSGREIELRAPLIIFDGTTVRSDSDYHTNFYAGTDTRDIVPRGWVNSLILTANTRIDTEATNRENADSDIRARHLKDTTKLQRSVGILLDDDPRIIINDHFLVQGHAGYSYVSVDSEGMTVGFDSDRIYQIVKGELYDITDPQYISNLVYGGDAYFIWEYKKNGVVQRVTFPSLLSRASFDDSEDHLRFRVNVDPNTNEIPKLNGTTITEPFADSDVERRYFFWGYQENDTTDNNISGTADLRGDLRVSYPYEYEAWPDGRYFDVRYDSEGKHVYDVDQNIRDVMQPIIDSEALEDYKIHLSLFAQLAANRQYGQTHINALPINDNDGLKNAESVYVKGIDLEIKATKPDLFSTGDSEQWRLLGEAMNAQVYHNLEVAVIGTDDDGFPVPNTVITDGFDRAFWDSETGTLTLRGHQDSFGSIYWSVNSHQTQSNDSEYIEFNEGVLVEIRFANSAFYPVPPARPRVHLPQNGRPKHVSGEIIFQREDQWDSDVLATVKPVIDSEVAVGVEEAKAYTDLRVDEYGPWHAYYTYENDYFKGVFVFRTASDGAVHDTGLWTQIGLVKVSEYSYPTQADATASNSAGGIPATYDNTNHLSHLEVGTRVEFQRLVGGNVTIEAEVTSKTFDEHPDRNYSGDSEDRYTLGLRLISYPSGNASFTGNDVWIARFQGAKVYVDNAVDSDSLSDTLTQTYIDNSGLNFSSVGNHPIRYERWVPVQNVNTGRKVLSFNDFTNNRFYQGTVRVDITNMDVFMIRQVRLTDSETEYTFAQWDGTQTGLTVPAGNPSFDRVSDATTMPGNFADYAPSARYRVQVNHLFGPASIWEFDGSAINSANRQVAGTDMTVISGPSPSEIDSGANPNTNTVLSIASQSTGLQPYVESLTYTTNMPTT